MLDNLLGNARHATHPAGASPSASATGTTRPRWRSPKPGPASHLPTAKCIFDRFTGLPGTYPRGPHDHAPDGNGLGLAIARGIAAAHHGTLSCAEPAHGGASFLLQLPRPAAPGKPAQPDQHPVRRR